MTRPRRADGLRSDSREAARRSGRARVEVSLPADVLRMLDEMAAQWGTTRSDAIARLLLIEEAHRLGLPRPFGSGR